MKANILIVEDDPMVQFIHRSYLERLAVFERIFRWKQWKKRKKCYKKKPLSCSCWISI